MLREGVYGGAPVPIKPSDKYRIGVVHAIKTETVYRFERHRGELPHDAAMG